MIGSRIPLPSPLRSLSASLLLLTVIFVMVAEVLIYVPSVARFRLVYLEDRLAAGQLATLSLKAAPDGMVDEDLKEELLRQVNAHAVVLKRGGVKALMLSDDMPSTVEARFDLRGVSPAMLVSDALGVLVRGPRIIQVAGASTVDPATTIELVMDEKQMRTAMIDYSSRILTLSIVISLITASLVYLSLQLLMVRPMRRITESMSRFRAAPEEAVGDIAPSARGDEIGIVQRELAQMQSDLRHSLREKARLAALGAAVSKINHDLRNILGTAQLVSDRLSTSPDPEVQRLTPPLVQSIDRAINLCVQTLSFGRADEPQPERRRFELGRLVDDVGASLGLTISGSTAWHNEVPDRCEVFADREQIFRALLNLGRNALEAMKGGGEVRVRAERHDGRVAIDLTDSGPGLNEAARRHLFEAFAGAGRRGGIGLGLVIARDLARGNGGELTLLSSGSEGTVFRLDLPAGDGA